MTDVLGPEGTAMLAGLARTRLLLAFDFDGTLAPIVVDRDKAVMRPETRRLVTQVCRLYPCAVISGRSRSDVEQRVAGTGVKHVIGNHGIEPCPRMADYERDAAHAYALLRQSFRGRDGIDLEDKRYSLAIHYRRAPDRRRARIAIRVALSLLPMRMRIVPGKQVVNVLPWGAPDKGDALLHLKAVEGTDAVLYVGDDTTDEDVFKLDPGESVFCVRVGFSHGSSAAYFLHDQHAVDRLLERLVELRGSPGW